MPLFGPFLSVFLAANSGEVLLSGGPAPVTSVLKHWGEGLYGVGRPQQATGHVWKHFSVCVRACVCSCD